MPDVQYFSESGTWFKPPGAVRVDYLICAGGGGGGASFAGRPGSDGEPGEVVSGSISADQLPDRVEVTVGPGGRGAGSGGDGQDGYALFLTHLDRPVPHRESQAVGLWQSLPPEADRDQDEWAADAVRTRWRPPVAVELAMRDAGFPVVPPEEIDSGVSEDVRRWLGGAGPA